MENIEIHLYDVYAIIFVLFSMVGLIRVMITIADVVEKVFNYFDNK